MIFLIIILTTSTYALNLNLEDKGEEVEKIQQMLSDLGYDITVDGIYGHKTKNIVQSFQSSNNLEVDCIVGGQTLQLLDERSGTVKYLVKKGDTLSEIAQMHEISINVIKEENNISSNRIIIGQNLSITKTGIGGGEEKKLYSNILHKVKPGDTLLTLAKKYGTNIETIKLANNLKGYRIFIGRDLIIPHLSNDTNRSFKLVKGAFIWPVLGRISSEYGWRSHPLRDVRDFHSALDIAVPLGEEIRAAAAGKVIQSGWIKGFGKTIIIQHGNGVQTLYAHNSRLLINNGRQINIGEVIALAGSTGQSTGSHLHFAILVNNKSVNPRKYLP
jgi:LysM repeat protein